MNRRFTRKITNNKFNRVAFYETESTWCEVFQAKHPKTKQWQNVGIKWPQSAHVGFPSNPNRFTETSKFAAMLKAANKLAQKWQKEVETNS